MTRDEAANYIRWKCLGFAEKRDGTEWADAMFTAVEALAECDEYEKVFMRRAITAVKSERKHGEWKPKNHHTDYCTECGFEETQWRTEEYNYCPNCGASMR